MSCLIKLLEQTVSEQLQQGRTYMLTPPFPSLPLILSTARPLQVLALALPPCSSALSWLRGPGCCSTGPAASTSSLTRSPWWRPSFLTSWNLWPGELRLFLGGLVCKRNFTSEGIESKIVQTMLKYKNLVLWAVDYVDMWWRYVATSSQVI